MTRNFRYFGRDDLFRVGARCEAIREITRRRLAQLVDETATGRTREIVGVNSHEKTICS